MKKEIPNPYPSTHCFFCGTDNHHGLKLKFYWDEEKKEMSAEYLPAPHFAGQGNILHGAIQTGLMDEIMGWTCFIHTGELAVTTELIIRFLSPLYMPENIITVTCRVVEEERPRIKMEAALANRDGIICTTAAGTFRIISSQKYKSLVRGS